MLYKENGTEIMQRFVKEELKNGFNKVDNDSYSARKASIEFNIHEKLTREN